MSQSTLLLELQISHARLPGNTLISLIATSSYLFEIAYIKKDWTVRMDLAQWLNQVPIACTLSLWIGSRAIKTRAKNVGSSAIQHGTGPWK